MVVESLKLIGFCRSRSCDGVGATTLACRDCAFFGGVVGLLELPFISAPIAA